MAFSEPGIASSGHEPEFETQIHERYCVECRIIREPTTMHCTYCDVCIYGYDHHCPWIGKCVGRDNLRDFYLFLLAFGVMLLAHVISVLMIL